MGIGLGLLLVALGAVLRFAVHASISGIDLSTVGVILMIVGILGLLFDMVVLLPRRRSSRIVTTDAVGLDPADAAYPMVGDPALRAGSARHSVVQTHQTV